MAETSRDRVNKALNHIQPEQVPVDLSSNRATSINAMVYRKLREHLGLPEKPIRIYDVVQHLAVVDDDVLDYFGIDLVDVGRAFYDDMSIWKHWQLPDGTDCLIPEWTNIKKEGDDWYLYSPDGKPLGIQKPHMFNFDQIHWPFVDGIPDDLSNLPEILANEIMWNIPKPPNLATTTMDELAEAAKRLRESTDRAIIAPGIGRLMETGQYLCRNDNFLLMLAAEPENVHRLLDRLLEIYLPQLEQYVLAVGSYVDVIRFGDDLGMQSGPQISPEMYREFFKPRHAILWKKVKELSNAKVALHCCGGIRPLLEDLIDAGLDAINPVQTSAAGMDPIELKSEFGDRLCFWGGGCDTQSVLPRATPDEVRKHVLERLKIFSPNGGFIFAQVHNITAEVPPENVIAMFDAVADFNGKNK